MNDEEPKCEGCAKPAVTTDSEGVYLCQACFDDLEKVTEAADLCADRILTMVTDALNNVPCRIDDISGELHSPVLHEGIMRELIGERKKLEEENARLRRLVAALLNDSARLDCGLIYLGNCVHTQVDLRAAIDRAVKHENAT